MVSLKRTTLLFISLFLLGALLRLAADAKSQRQQIEVSAQYGRTAITIYLVDASKRFLVPVSRRVLKGEQNDPRRAMAALLDGPQAGPELRAVLLPQTRLLSFEVDGHTAAINLSAPAFATQKPGQAIEAIRLTMTEFASISAVELALDGRPLDELGNSAAHACPLPRPQAINAARKSDGQPATLYYGYGSKKSLLVPMTCYLSVSDNLVAAAIKRLLAGPPAGSGLVSVIPANVRLLKASLDQGVALVDLSEELVHAYRLQQANALKVRKAVIATLTSLPDVYAGAIKIGGSALLYYSCQNVVMERPQAKPWAINDEFYLKPLESKKTI